MAAEIPTFKLVLVGDGGTGMRREERRCKGDGCETDDAVL